MFQFLPPTTCNDSATKPKTDPYSHDYAKIIYLTAEATARSILLAMAFITRSLWGLLLFCAVLDSLRFAFASNASSPAPFPEAFGDPRSCPLAKGIYRFEVLPGGGWDNLRNQHMGVVSVMNYSKCKISDDGKYLIPDNVYLYPVKKSKVEAFAELYDHWNNYSSTTTRSVNAEASGKFVFGSISGSFSSEFESVKKHQVEDKSVTTRVQMRHVLYTAKLQPDSGLQPAFKTRLLEIASHLQHNNTAYANFLAQILVRDFGTHFIASVNAGAVLAKVDHLTKKFVADFTEDKSKITASASASFFGAFGAKASYSQTTDKQDLDQYTKNTVYSTVYTFGGPPFRVNFTINQWEDQMQDELVAVDRSGDPLHYAITPGSLPELSEDSTFELANVVEKAITQYYKHNTITGCTKMDSPNFSFQANLDDGSCESPYNNYTFGGVYQTCEFDRSPAGNPCEPLLQKNPLTSEYKCSEGYEAVLVHQGRTPQSCHRDCHGCWLFFRCCNTNCGYATYSTYWCIAKAEVPLNTGYMFGGIYSKVLKNPVTQTASCPLKFYPLRFGTTMQVCVSDDYELGFQQSVPFGGFFSCSAGNPLGVKKSAVSGSQGEPNLDMFVSQSGPPGWPKSCPNGYSQHLGAIEEDCEINYCVKSNVFNSQGLPIIRRPPYMSTPKILNFSVPLMLINHDSGQIWFKRPGINPQWLLATKASTMEFSEQINIEGPAIAGMNLETDDLSPATHKNQKSSQSSSDAMDAGTAAGITFGVTVLAGLLIVVVVIGWRRHKHVSRESSNLAEPLNSAGGYGSLQNADTNQRV